MSDLVQRLRDSVRAARALDRSALLAEAADEIERLRGGTKPMPEEKRAEVSYTLTGAEREAIRFASVVFGMGDRSDMSVTLRSLLERLA